MCIGLTVRTISELGVVARRSLVVSQGDKVTALACTNHAMSHYVSSYTQQNVNSAVFGCIVGSIEKYETMLLINDERGYESIGLNVFNKLEIQFSVK